jgi:YbgC/YbaW family acyl-CoA thioester hydrolase
VSRLPAVQVTVYPHECDANGRLNESAFLALLERARWEILARGPGMDVFRKQGIWPAVRRVVADFLHPVFPGDLLEVELHLDKLGRTSVELRQRATRASDGAVVAESHLVFVMIDGSGNPTPVPEEVASLFGTRVSTRSGHLVRYDVGEVTLAADVRGDGPALLLIHGFPLDRSVWAHQVATLSGWRRIAPDLRGLGASDAPQSGYSMASYADDLARLLDRLRVEKAVVAGLSLGGYIVFEMLRRHRGRLAALILVDTKAEADTEEGKRSREELAELATSKGTSAVAERMIPKLLGATTQQTQAQLVDRVREMITGASAHGVAGALRAMSDRPDSTSLLSSIDVPTLVVVGDEDELTPPGAAKAMGAAIPEAHVTVIPGAGHLSPLEAPTAVSRVFAEFLEAVRT